MLGFATYDKNKKATLSYSTCSRATCEEFTRVAYGIPRFTWGSNLSLIRQGPAALKAKAGITRWNAAGRAARAAERTTSKSEAIA
eukprot:3518576-Pleurochrysis_carterae.AAC.1